MSRPSFGFPIVTVALDRLIEIYYWTTSQLRLQTYEINCNKIIEKQFSIDITISSWDCGLKILLKVKCIFNSSARPRSSWHFGPKFGPAPAGAESTN